MRQTADTSVVQCWAEGLKLNDPTPLNTLKLTSVSQHAAVTYQSQTSHDVGGRSLSQRWTSVHSAGSVYFTSVPL